MPPLLARLRGARTRPTADSEPAPPPTLDAQLRATLQQWGAVPIGAVNAPRCGARGPRQVTLLRQGAERESRRGVRDLSQSAQPHRGRPVALDRHGWHRYPVPDAQLGAGRQFTPRNAPALLNTGLGSFYLFWDGRVSDLGGGQSHDVQDARRHSACRRA